MYTHNSSHHVCVCVNILAAEVNSVLGGTKHDSTQPYGVEQTSLSHGMYLVT